MNVTYILKCSDGTLYTGWTNDIQKRLKAHNEGRGARYTRGRTPVELVYLEEFETKQEAMKRETAIKRLKKEDKHKLIAAYELHKRHICYKEVHHNEVAGASGHDEEVENLVGAEILMPGVENWKLQGVDDSTHSINYAAGQKPEESRMGKGIQNLGKCQDTNPAHGNVKHGRKPFGAGNPECLHQDSGNGDSPDKG